MLFSELTAGNWKNSSARLICLQNEAIGFNFHNEMTKDELDNSNFKHF
jgi:hypothetical protein